MHGQEGRKGMHDGRTVDCTLVVGVVLVGVVFVVVAAGPVLLAASCVVVAAHLVVVCVDRVVAGIDFVVVCAALAVEDVVFAVVCVVLVVADSLFAVGVIGDCAVVVVAVVPPAVACISPLAGYSFAAVLVKC